jgi:hypothetical protein
MVRRAVAARAAGHPKQRADPSSRNAVCAPVLGPSSVCLTNTIPCTVLDTEEVKEGVKEIAAAFFDSGLKPDGNDGIHFTRYLAQPSRRCASCARAPSSSAGVGTEHCRYMVTAPAVKPYGQWLPLSDGIEPNPA